MNDISHGRGSAEPGVLPSRQVLIIIILSAPLPVLSNNMEKPVL